MKKNDGLDEADYIRAGISLNPDTLRQYKNCMECGWGNECSSCQYSENLDAVMIAFLRPRPMMPTLC